MRTHSRMAAALALAGAALCGCAPGVPGLYGSPGVSPAAEKTWKAPARAILPPPGDPAVPAIPPEFLAAPPEWSLAQIVDLALRNSSETRAAWAEARAAAGAYGSARGEYFPEIHVGAAATRQQFATSGGQSTMPQSTFTPSADLSWTLFDFGGREASVAGSRAALLAADWTHNATIQDVVLRVERAYYEYVAAVALVEAEGAAVKEAETALGAATARHEAGLATIADILVARTALSRARLALQGLEGRLRVARGALATGMGLPANIDYEVALPPDTLPTERAIDAVEAHLERARLTSPDLQAARARVRGAEANLREVKAEGYPSLTIDGAAGRTFYDDPEARADSWSASVALRWPLFTGFAHGHDVAEARAEVEIARRRAERLEQAVLLDVWSSYYDLRTAGQRLRTSEDFVKSAAESHDVASGRYESGVGSILDLLTAQASLENARAERAAARSDWFISLARLARAAGTPFGSTEVHP